MPFDAEKRKERSFHQADAGQASIRFPFREKNIKEARHTFPFPTKVASKLPGQGHWEETERLGTTSLSWSRRGSAAERTRKGGDSRQKVNRRKPEPAAAAGLEVIRRGNPSGSDSATPFSAAGNDRDRRRKTQRMNQTLQLRKQKSGYVIQIIPLDPAASQNSVKQLLSEETNNSAFIRRAPVGAQEETTEGWDQAGWLESHWKTKPNGEEEKDHIFRVLISSWDSN
nr:uncharacterized protein LOC112584382 [Bubalus bubalis]